MSKVLILEDDYDWQDILSTGVRKNTRWGVLECYDNLFDAIESARRTEFGLYICDGDFPLSAGQKMVYGAFFQFYEQLRQIRTNPNIVLITLNEENILRGRGMGIDCFPKSGNDWDAFYRRLQLNQP